MIVPEFSGTLWLPIPPSCSSAAAQATAAAWKPGVHNAVELNLVSTVGPWLPSWYRVTSLREPEKGGRGYW